MATKEQIAANRRNARKSTGPSGAAAARTRLNAIKHGLRSPEPVLPTEDPAEFRAFVDAWVADWGPPTMARLQLVEDAAFAAWRKKRCVRVESARLSARVREAQSAWDRKRSAALDRHVADLETSPGTAVRALAATRGGVDLLIAMWSEVARAAASPDGWVELLVHHARHIYLHGWCPGDDEAIALRDASWRLYLRNAPESRTEDDPEPLGDAEAAALCEDFRAGALDQIARLLSHRESLPDDAASRDEHAECAAFDPRPEDALLLRYEAQLDRQFRRSLGDLVKLSQTGADLVEAEGAEDAPDTPEKTDSTPVDPVTSAELASFGAAPSTGSAEAPAEVAPAQGRGRRRPCQAVRGAHEGAGSTPEDS